MFACRWIEVFALVWCLAWTADAGSEDLSQFSETNHNVSGTKLIKVSGELQDGNLITQCSVFSLPKPEQLAEETNTTAVYNTESIFETSTNTSDISFIKQEAKKYLVAHDSEKSFSKTQLLDIILNVMLDRNIVGVNTLKSELESEGFDQEAPEITVVRLPNLFEVERIVNNCTVFPVVNTVGRTDAMGTVTVPDTAFSEQPGIKITDLLKGSATTEPSREPLNRRFITESSHSKLTTHSASPPPRIQQTATSRASLQLSISGIITASLPLSISKVMAQLSLSFAPVGAPASETNSSSLFTVTNIPHGRSSLSPAKSLPSTTNSISKNTTPTSSTIFSHPLMNFTTVTSSISHPIPVSQSSAVLPTATSVTSTPPPFSASLSNTSSQPSLTELNTTPSEDSSTTPVTTTTQFLT